MSYRIQVSGKIFESDDLRTLLKRAVEARQNTGFRPDDSGGTPFPIPPIPQPLDSRLRKTGRNRMAYSLGF